MRRVAAPYIAGPTLEDARRVVAEVNAEGMRATVDVLGEEVTKPQEAEAIAGAYHDALAAIESDGLDANVSVKLTALGLKVDSGLCRSLTEQVLRDAGGRGIFVRIDMEDSSTTDDTLALYRSLRADGYDGVGIVFQAALRRTLDDIAALAPLRPSVRLCKGIYVEPHVDRVPRVRGDPQELRRVPRRPPRGGLPGRGRDARRVAARAGAGAASTGLDETAYELQMLLGVRADRGRELVAAGHPLRIYVPYGRRWYEYSLRRLQENPKVAGYVAKDMLGRIIPGR